MRVTRLAIAVACPLLAGALLAGCGGSGGGETTGGGAGKPAASRPAPPKSEFPATEGRSLKQLIEQVAENRSELLVEAGAKVFYTGENRYPLGISEKNGTQINDAEVALYYAKVPVVKAGSKSKSGNKGQEAKAKREALEQPAVGPFPAKIESLATKPAYRSKTTTEDPYAARVVYSARIDFPSEGEWRLAALIKEGDEIGNVLLPTVKVGEFKKVPRAGQRAPLIHTPTAAEVGGDLSKITTRVPPDNLNQVDYAEVLGKEPILLLFATPKFCQSRVCGPVVDVAEEAKQRYGDEAAFIHMEIYNENDPGKGVRPQVRAFHLPSEPWLYAINSEGVISSAVEGAFGRELMDEIVEKVISE